MFVFQALESGEYSAFGSIVFGTHSQELYSFEAYSQLNSSSVRLSINGSARAMGRIGKHDFFFEVRPTDNSGVSFLYRDNTLPEVHGSGCWVKDCYLLIGQCAHTGAKITCQLVPNENQVFSARALVLFQDDRRVSVHFTLGPHEPLTAMANIVSISRKRRA
jgi:hypothetical protein